MPACRITQNAPRSGLSWTHGLAVLALTWATGACTSAPLADVVDGEADIVASDTVQGDTVRVDTPPPPGDDGTPLDATLPPDGTVPPDAPPPPGCPPPGPVTANSTVPEALTAPSPTIRNVSIEWRITGDADGDGVVGVRFRVAGGAWRVGLPLRRTPAGSTSGFSWPNRHSGSIFDLEPDTLYEIELALRDPDGGCDTRNIMVRTRPVPAIPSGGTVRAVTPANFASAMASAAPGDILDLAAGTYPTFTFSRDGAAGRPIVVRGASGAIVDGNVELIARRHLYLTGLQIRGRVRLNSAFDVSIVRNTITTTGDGVVAFLRAENCYVADNVITGATPWTVPAIGASGANIGEGIALTGPGNVIEHNRVTGFRDAISLLEDSAAAAQYSIDIVENDIYSAADDGIEADFCFHNCRVVRNRMTNVFIAMSSQPGLGGPTYFVRNVAYNVILSTFKLQRSSVGDVLLHNTSVKNGDAFGIYTSEPIARAYARNNLFIGGPGAMFGTWSSGTGRVIEIATLQPNCDLDYDGFGSTNGMFAGRFGASRFNNLAELRSMTTETHAVSIDLSVFAASVAYPSAPFPALATPDLRLRAGAAAVDVGQALGNINDGYSGPAPDLGAYELGGALPTYGPR